MFFVLQERKRLLNEDLVSEVPVNTSYHDRSRRSRRNHGGSSGSERNQGADNQEEHFQEVTNEVSTLLLKYFFKH